MLGRVKILTSLGFIFSIIGYNLWKPVKLVFGTAVFNYKIFNLIDIRFSIFYFFIALSFLTFSYTIHYALKCFLIRDKRVLEVFPYTRVLIGVCFSNIFDELFFDPTAFSINEYIAFAIIVIIEVYHYKKLQK